MPKKTNFLVGSVLVVYLGLIGANVIWQHGGDVFGANLKSKVEGGEGGEVDPKLLENAAEAEMAREVAPLQAARDEAKIKAKNAADQVRATNQTDSQKEIAEAPTAATWACQQDANSCGNGATVQSPREQITAMRVEAAKNGAKVLEQVEVQMTKFAEVQQKALGKMREGVKFAAERALPIPEEYGQKLEELQKMASEKCLSTMNNLTQVAGQMTEALAPAAESMLGFVAESFGTEAGEDGSESTTIEPPRLGISEADLATAKEFNAEEMVAAAKEAAEAQQAEAQNACAALSSIDVSGATKSYSTFLNKLNSLGAGIDSTQEKTGELFAGAQETATAATAAIQEKSAAQKTAAFNSALTVQQKQIQDKMNSAEGETSLQPIPIGLTEGEEIIPVTPEMWYNLGIQSYNYGP